ncbi:MAG: sulfatase [Candidatus Nanopelagicales bacterium]
MMRIRHALIGLIALLLCVGPSAALAVNASNATAPDATPARAAKPHSPDRQSAPADGGAAVGDKRPNIVILQTDDQTLADLAVMKRARSMLQMHGVTFNQMITPFAICCPSRAAHMTGSYPHNNGVSANFPPAGGYVPWEKKSGKKSIGYWLQQAGYYTVHIGKYINGYAYPNRDNVKVPTGWSEWHGSADPSTYQMWGYQLNEPGGSHTYGKFRKQDPATYSTDVYRRKAVRVVRQQARRPGPFFLQVAFLAPHVETVPLKSGFIPQPWVDTDDPDPQFGIKSIPPRPAPRDKDKFPNMPLARGPSFNEADVSDKGPFVRDLPLLTHEEIQDMVEDNRRRRRSLLAVDDAVRAVVKNLRSAGELKNTIIVFMGDNGYLLGQHRISMGKYFPYEPALRIPFVMRGPGIRANAEVNRLVSLIDLTPTLLDFAHAKPTGRHPDGMSLRPVLSGHHNIRKRPVLLSSGPQRAPNGENLPLFDGVRNPHFAWWRYEDGFEEMYDLRNDPDELTNIAQDPEYAQVRDKLVAEWNRLKDCYGRTCRIRASAP